MRLGEVLGDSVASSFMSLPGTLPLTACNRPMPISGTVTLDLSPVAGPALGTVERGSLPA